MKFALFLALLAIAASCSIAQRIHIWGNVDNTILTFQRRFIVPGQVNQVQTRTASVQAVSFLQAARKIIKIYPYS